MTMTATTPDGHTSTRNSRTKGYTHARWIKFPEDNHQVIVSWHHSADAAARSPFQSPTWRSLPHGIVEVTAS